MKWGGFLCVPVLAFVSAVWGQANERVLYNARIFTAEPDHPYAEAVALRGDKIVAVGTRAEVARSVGANAAAEDLQGRTLLPGLIDSHTHVLDSGLALRTDVNDKVQTVDDLAAFAIEAKRSGRGMYGDVLSVTGVSNLFFQDSGKLSAKFNAGAFAEQPVLLSGADGHAGWANAALLRRAGVTQEFLRGLSDTARRYYGHTADLQPNGFVVDYGLDKVSDVLPPPTLQMILEGGRMAIHYNLSLGITAWLEPSDIYASIGAKRPSLLNGYKALAEGGELAAHVALFPEVDAKGIAEQLAGIEALRQQFKDVPNLTIPGIKIFEDGVVEYPSHTAALSKPYSDGSNGELLFPPEKLAEVATQADRQGLIVHVHAIGDEAVKVTLDAFAAARKANGNSGLPHTIAHLQFVRPQDFPRFRELGVIACMQLLWAQADAWTIEAIKPYIAPEIYQWQYPARSLLDAGATISGGSDWSVSSANVFEAMYYAETRKGSAGVLDASQRMPREAMLYAYTRNSARAMNQQEHIGSIAPGKQVDLVLVDRDVLTVSAEELKDTKVLWTMIGGKMVYRSGE